MESKYLSALYGRVFILLERNHLLSWGGIDENSLGDDYSLLEDLVECEDAGFSNFSHKNVSVSILFSMSTKLEVFVSDLGWYIYDGMYSDASIRDAKLIKTEVIEQEIHTLNKSDSSFCILDATIAGKTIINDESDKNPESEDYLFFDLIKPCYKVNKIESLFLLDDSEFSLFGISIIQEAV
jgi:hypothetical protein